MPNPVALSRKFLSDLGGWKEMKEARLLHASGRIENASYEGGVLQGLVRDKGKVFKTRLRILSETEVENLCPCYAAQRDGRICSHALAVGLEVIEPNDEGPSSKTNSPAPARTGSAEKATALSPDWPPIVEEAAEDSVPARLGIVLPPKLAEAWTKGRVPVGVEVFTDEGRRLLSAMTGAGPLFLEPSDVSLYRVLQRISPEAVPGMTSLSTEDLSRLFSAVPGHEGITTGRDTPLAVSSQAPRLPLRHVGGLRFAVDWPEELTPLPSAHGCWVLEGGMVRPIAPGLESRFQRVLLGETSFDGGEVAEALGSWSRHFDLSGLEVERPSAEIRLSLEGSLNHLDADLSFRYGGAATPASTDRPLAWAENRVVVLADRNAEQAAIDELENAGFVPRGSGGRWVLKDKEAILQFLAFGYPRFRARHETVTGERFEHALTQIEAVETRLAFRSSGEDWFAMEVGFGTASGDTVPRQEIERLLQSGRASKALANGRTAVVDRMMAEQFGEILADCDPDQLQGGVYRIDQSHSAYLRETAEDHGFRLSGQVPWQSESREIEFYPLSNSLESVLRPYQREGLAWMEGLASRGMGGILADDMGLGKTLQTLAFLYRAGGVSLVVCPSSVVHNWIAEAEKFVPDVKAIAIDGPNRKEILARNDDADLFVTSYALLRHDEEVWLAREFDNVVLDEAQRIKNPDSKTSRIAHRLRGTHRLALTGTPVENSVRDIWSISAFCLPGYLGKRKDFAERFEKPLSSTDPPKGVRDRLARRLRPVVLRRLKNEVAPDLPDRIEQTLFCELGRKQREVYSKLLRESRESLLLADGSRRRMLALTALLRLRQTCCDLRLLGLENIDEAEASVKLERLASLLEEAIEGGHRVLIFSQFVGMLQLIVPELVEKRIGFCYLDGQSKDRAGIVRRFQEGNDPVFLISLKAGGVGLNLTAADTVIHVDPWWNPAVEAQATDRAHRIGQTEVVTSYKLIARDTVEEKILALQERKKSTAETLLADAGDAKLSDDELMNLFE